MQLKELGETSAILNKINTVSLFYNKSGDRFNDEATLIYKYSNALKDNSVEAVKLALAQTTLNEKQIAGILANKGLKGETLKTTAAELSNVTSTNAMSASQSVATIKTIGFKNAVTGLGTSLTNLAKAHPYLLAITTTLGIMYGAYKLVNALQDLADGTIAVNKYNESLEKSKQTISDNEKSISDYNSEIETNKKKIEELQELQSNGTITDAQKTEIENLKYQNALLDEKIEKLKQANDEELKAQTRTAENKFNTQFNESGDDTKSTNAKDVIERVSKNYGGDGSSNNIDWTSALGGNENDSSVAQLAKLKLATDAYNQALNDFNEAENDTTRENLDNAKETLDILTEDFEKNRESLYNSLIDEIEKMEKAKGTDDFNQQAYDSMLSWLDIFKQYVPEYKKAMEKVQQEAKENPVEQPVEFDDPSSLLTESNNKETSKATLADLKSEADLMQSLQSEIAKTGNIGVDSMQKIIKQFPEAKQYLADYMSGLITEQELFSKLEDVYAEDTQQYINSLVKKNETDADFFTNVKNNNETLFNGLAENYGFDIKNWNNLAKAKLDVDKQLMAELASIWTGYYTAQKDSVTGLYTLVTNPEFDVQDDSDLVTPEMEEARVKQMAIYDKYNQIIQSLNDAAGSFAKANIDLDWNVLGKDDSSSSSSSSKDTKEKFNWIEPLIKRISTAYSHLKNVVSDTTSTWLNRNNALSDSMSTLSSEINAQSQAYEYYMNAFNSYGLDDYYKNQIANGSISIDVIYDEDLKNAISDCQDFYDKAQDAKTAVQELGIELKGLAKSRFDNLKSQYEEQINQITKTNDLLQKEADIIDTKGWFASTLLNNSFIEQEQKNLDKLKEERTTLVNALNSAIDSGKIEEYSEDWYDMQSSIDDCTSSILDAEKALIEYDNAIRQINWDAFDRTRDDVEDLINETDFLVELLKDVGITDDNGNMTKEGQAAQALLAQKYQLYLNQAKAYKDEISKINEDLANDPYDKELLDRKQDLIDKEQEAIKSAMSEKDAIKDLTNDAYTDFIDKLGDAINKYKELMSTMKDAYDYEKSIREKTEALNALEKQYSAYQGDNSEEGKKNIQQLKDQINTAKDDLKDTEYEKLISDTEKILDQLQSDTQEWIDQRLDDLDNLIQDIIEQSNENASDISQTITSTAENYGYKLSESMASIWSTNTNNITKVLGDFGTSFIDSNNKIKDVCNDINAAVQGLLKNSNDEAQRMAEEIARQQQEQNSNNNNNYDNGGNNYDNNWENNWDSGSNDYDGGGSSGGVDWIYDPDDFNKDDLNIDTSIVDRLKWHDFASDFAARSQYYDQMGGDGEYYATYDQNVWMLDWMKSHGYRNGTKSATAGIHRTDEEGLGSEVIFSKKYGTLRKLDAGDMVFNADQVEKLWNLSKGITTPNMYMDNLGAKLPDIPNISNNLANKVDVEFGDVTLSLPNVHNYEDFMKQMVSDKRFLKAVQEGTFGQVLGCNSLNMLTFR